MNTIETNTLTVSSHGTLPSVPFELLKDTILGKKYTLSIAFVTSTQAQSLNSEHRNKEYIPNTLSFPLTKTSGEIILCKSAIRNEYKEFAMTYENYMLFIIIHSMLHLKGYSHGSTMESKEQKLLTFFTKIKNNESR